MDPLVTAVDLDEAVSDLDYTVQQYYQKFYPEEAAGAAIGLDGALRAIFEDLAETHGKPNGVEVVPAATLIRKLQRPLMPSCASARRSWSAPRRN